MTLFTRSLWPDTVQAPYRRLVIALILAPLVLSALLILCAFLINGMSDPTLDAVITSTVNAGLAILALMYGFTLIFGLGGIALLWSFGQRGLGVWAFTGGVTGVLAGAIFDYAFLGRMDPYVLIVFAVFGWVEFLLIRKFAGIRSD